MDYEIVYRTEHGYVHHTERTPYEPHIGDECYWSHEYLIITKILSKKGNVYEVEVKKTIKDGIYLVTCPVCRNRFKVRLSSDNFKEVFLLARYREQTVQCNECYRNIYVNQETCKLIESLD